MGDSQYVELLLIAVCIRTIIAARVIQYLRFLTLLLQESSFNLNLVDELLMHVADK